MKHLLTLTTALSVGFLSFASSPSLSAAETQLDSILLEADRRALSSAESKLIDAAKAHLDNDDPAIAKAARELLEILKLPRKEAPTPASLVGKWKVRSIQAGSLGVFAYPFFPCDFRKAPANEIHFLKNAGSQRSFGIVGPSGDGELLFVGSSYYSDEKPDIYSNLQDNRSESDPDRDRVGYLYPVGKNHLIMIFTKGELYELKR